MIPIRSTLFAFGSITLLLATACGSAPAASPSQSASPSAATAPAKAGASPTIGTKATAPAGSPVAPAAASPAASTFDQQFIDMMVPHHQGAVEMARIAETRSQRPEIKQLVADIVRSQNAEIDLMKNWRRDWFGSDQTPPLSQMPMVDGLVMPSMNSTPGGGNTPGMGTLPGMDHGAAPVGTSSPGASMMDLAKDVETLRNAPEPFDQAFIDAMIPHHESAIAAAKAAETRAQRPEIKELAATIIRDQEREIAQMREWRRAWFGA